jgi:NTP pyrophosphatase (non-canonical NTP hydrolase)
MAAVGELGEMGNKLKKQLRGEYIDGKEIAWELADAIIYLDLLATHLQINLAEVLREKFNIVSDRYESDIKL